MKFKLMTSRNIITSKNEFPSILRNQLLPEEATETPLILLFQMMVGKEAKRSQNNGQFYKLE